MLRDHTIPLFEATAAFISPHELQVNGNVVRAERFIIATGSAPAVPPIQGLKETG